MFSETINIWLQQFSCPGLDGFFKAVSALGSEQFYLLFLLFIYWCWNRRLGREVVLAFLATAWLNSVLKDAMGFPRPSADLVQVMAYEWSNGFPSGHVQLATTVWGYLAWQSRQRGMRIGAFVFVLLIALSRLYLGMHFLGDVVGGFLLGILVIVAVMALEHWAPLKRLPAGWRISLSIILPLLGALLVQSDNGFRLAGVWSALLLTDVSYTDTDERKRFSWATIAGRALVGFVGFICAYIVVKMLVPAGIATYLAYMAATVWVTTGAPALFRRLNLDMQKPIETNKVARPLVTPAFLCSLCLLLTLGISLASVEWSAALGGGSAPVIGSPAAGLPKLPGDGPVLVLGHKGADGLAPGNTLYTFALALEQGVDMLELDVWLSKDGHVVVIHDANVDAVTEGKGAVKELTLRQLQNLDAGYRYTTNGYDYPFRGQGLRIPALAEVLAAFPQARINIDMKDHSAPMPAALLQVLDQANARERVIVASFDGPTIRSFRALAPDIPTALAKDEITRFVLMTRLGVGVFYRTPACYLQIPEREGSILLATPSMMKLARRRGMDVHVWTINDRGTMRRLIQGGVQGIVSDHPNWVREVLYEFELM
jgi:glycerophosphoryl diester phosphodiesterase